jgi:hypothetical protein
MLRLIRQAVTIISVEGVADFSFQLHREHRVVEVEEYTVVLLNLYS